MEICDAYTVMRDGCVVSSGAVGPDISEQLLAKYMVGKELSYNDLYMERTIGPDILRVENLSRASEFTNINFHGQKGFQLYR